jgi:hypothetical protein
VGERERAAQRARVLPFVMVVRLVLPPSVPLEAALRAASREALRTAGQ